MTASDVVHLKAVLAEELRTTHVQAIADGFIHSLRESALPNETLPEFVSATYDGTDLCDDMGRAVAASENYYVAPNMLRLASMIADSMPDEDLLPQDLPAPQGFMVFAEPFRVIDIRRKALSVNAVLWSAFGGQVTVYAMCHKSDPGDSSNLYLRHRYGDDFYARQVPLLNLNHIYSMDFGEPLPRGISWDTPLPWDAKVDLKFTDTGDGSYSYTLLTDHVVDISEEPTMTRAPLAAFLVCLWRLCQQTLAVSRVEPLNRDAKKRLRRANVPERAVTYITLRRHSGNRTGTGTVEWTHQWAVKGYWRRQRYKEGGVFVYRALYIHPYIKGPPDKPLLIRERVNLLKR